MPITGRPRGDISKAIEASIRSSGPDGMTLADLRKKHPDFKDPSIKFAVSNLRDRKGFWILQSGRLGAYIAPGVDEEQAKARFALRIAAHQAELKAKQAEYTRAYLARVSAEKLAARQGPGQGSWHLRHRAEPAQSRCGQARWKKAADERPA